jgi:5-methylthioadenosine/S-adenosylhomocysteine deaminase
MSSQAGSTICFKGGHLWTGEAAGAREGGLVVRDRKITARLSPEETEIAAKTADVVVDARGMLLLPPFFDSHVHSNATLLRGTENSLPLELWSYHAINYGRQFTERSVRASVRLTAVEMIRGGIGGYVDHFPQSQFATAALAAHQDSGLRIGFAPFFADLHDEDILRIPVDRNVSGKFVSRAPRETEVVRELFVRLNSLLLKDRHGCVTLLLGPNAPQRCSEEMWHLWVSLRDELGLGSHTHLLETLPQAMHAAQRWRNGLIAELDRVGLLDEKLSVAHGIWLDESGFETLAKRGVTVAHNPMSNQMLGSGRLDVRTALTCGVAIGLGTDSSNTGGRHDLFEVMRQMLTAGRTPGSDFEMWIKPEEALRAACHAGVGALGPNTGLGVLKEGGPADILVVDFKVAGLAAALPSASALVVHGDARNVHSLMVNGEWLLKDGHIEAFDEEEAVREASDCAAELRALTREAEADLGNLRSSYRGWHQKVFSDHRCPACFPSSMDGSLRPARPPTT